MLGACATYSLVTFPTELGWMALLGSDEGVRELTFGHAAPDAAIRALRARTSDSAEEGDPLAELVERLSAYAQGCRDDFSDVRVDLPPLSTFQARVVKGCRRISYGGQQTYGELAASAGYPGAARAVGRVMATNLVPLIIPCHRVVAASGRLGGYSAGEGVRLKLRLLEMESAAARGR